MWLSHTDKAFRSICIGYITRCRCLQDLYTEGRTARGCINPVATEPSDITGLYHGPIRCAYVGSAWQHLLHWIHLTTIRVYLSFLCSNTLKQAMEDELDFILSQPDTEQLQSLEKLTADDHILLSGPTSSRLLHPTPSKQPHPSSPRSKRERFKVNMGLPRG